MAKSQKAGQPAADPPQPGPAERRAQQARIFRRNQMLGLLLIAAAILIWGMLNAPKGWLFPPGWWKFW